MKWEKLGLIISPGKYEWIVNHAQNPFSETIESDIYKIHFAGRDKRNRARGGWAVIDINNPTKLLDFSDAPSIDLGRIGCFDDSGVMPSCIVDKDGQKYMYYTGWSKAITTPFTFYTGLMVSSDGGKSFERYSLAPVLGRSFHDPFLTCSPWVIIENNVWKMWYVSGTGWDVSNKDIEAKHFYNIKYAESEDGIHWNNNGIICIDFLKDEYAIARPTVLKENNIYKMWYCFRGGFNRYRAGYAESQDGIKWTRKDNLVGIDVSSSGWDSEMICYPCILKNNGNDYLLYNGNDYGRTGVGLAKRTD